MEPMRYRPTPETDAAAEKCRSFKEMGVDFNGMVMHAEKLERERDMLAEALQAADECPTPETAPLMHAAANESIEAMFRMGCDLERQLAEARAKLSELTNLGAREMISLEERFRTAEHQRDRLAEALQAADECLALIEDVGHGAHMDNVTVARGIVQKALAAVEGEPNSQAQPPDRVG